MCQFVAIVAEIVATVGIYVSNSIALNITLFCHQDKILYLFS